MGKEGKKGTGDRHFSLRFQIRFVGDDDDREKVFVLHPENLLMESGDFIVRIPWCDTIHTQEPFACPHILFPHRTVQRGRSSPTSVIQNKEERTERRWCTYILLGRRYPERPAERPRRRWHIVFGTSLRRGRERRERGDVLWAIRYLSYIFFVESKKIRQKKVPSIVGSYSSTKCDWMNCMVSADLPTPDQAAVDRHQLSSHPYIIYKGSQEAIH